MNKEQERIDAIIDSISLSHIEEQAVDGLFRGINEELKYIGIDRKHELYDQLFDEINSMFIVTRN